MPPNTTAVLQPLDQGIIHCVKVGYRRILVKKAVVSNRERQEHKAVSERDVITRR